MTEFMRWLEAERGLRLRRLRGALALVGRRPRGLLGGDLGLLRRPGRRRPRRAVLGSREMPGAEWFAGTRAQLRRARLRRQGRRRDGDPPRLRAARARRAELGRAARPGRRGRRRPARRSGSSAATASSPTCRTSPRRSSPSSPPPAIGAIWSSCSPDFGPASVIDRFAQIEPKVLFAVDGYRYGGKDFDRREIARRAAGGDAEPRAHRRPPLPRPRPRPLRPARRDALGRAARRRRGRRARLRARPLRPPALGPLLLRHHRPAEGDRPGPGRDPARAPEEAPPPRRRPPRRPPLLVHDDRLDDVELPRLRPADPRRDRPLRRQPRPPRHGRALGPRRAGRDHHVRHQRLLHRRLHEGRGRARRRPRPQPPQGGRLDRLPPLPRGLRLDLRAARRRHLALLDQRRHRPLHRLRRRRRRCCPSTAASCRRGRSAPRSRPGTRTATR